MMVLTKSDILFSTAFTKSLAERCLQRMLFVKKVGKRGLNCMFAQKVFCRTLFVKKLGIRDDSSRFAHKERSAERFLCKHAIQTPFSYFFHKERSAERFLCKHAIQTPFFLLFFTKSVLQNTLFAKVALQAPNSQYFRPAERYCEQMHQRGPPKTPKTSKTHRTIKNILLVSCTIVFDG